jgi:hypothetical protein
MKDLEREREQKDLRLHRENEARAWRDRKDFEDALRHRPRDPEDAPLPLPSALA